MLRLHRQAGAGATCASAMIFPATRNNAAAVPAKPGEEVVELKAFTVSTDRDKGYGATNALGAARVNTALKDTPMTVVTLTAQFLKDSGAIDPADAAKYVSGVNLASSGAKTGQLALRGYNSGGVTSFRDGLPDPQSAFGQQSFDMATLDRMEIIKGAAGVLYGSSSLGGIINRVSKMPLNTDQTEIRVTGGDYNLWRVDLDVNRPVNAKLGYRLILAEQQGEMFWGGHDDRRVISPIVVYRPNRSTKVWGRFEYQRLNYSAQSTSLFTDSAFNISTFIPYSLALEDKNDLGDDKRYQGYEAGLEKAFKTGVIDWSIRAVGRFSKITFSDVIMDKTSFTFINATGASLRNAANAVMTTRNTTFTAGFATPGFYDIRVARSARYQVGGGDDSSLNVDVVLDFPLGPTRHKLLTYAVAYGSHSDSNVKAYAFPSIDVFHPVYFDDPASKRTSPVQNILSKANTDPYSWAWGLSDNISLLNDRVNFTGGLRYDQIRSLSTDLIRNAVTDTGARNWSHRYGIVGKPWKFLSSFAVHSETFEPGGGAVDSFGNRTKNRVGKSDEIGAKFDLFDGGLVFTGSYFDMTLNPFQISTLVPGTSNRLLVDSGKNSTWGHEMDAAWQPIRSVTLLAGYGNLKSRNPQGQRFRHVAEGPNYKFFGKYEFLEGILKGVSAGFGYQFTPSRAADAGDTFSLPAYHTSEAMLAYQWKRWKVQVNVYNLTNEYVPYTSINRDRIYLLDPRNYRASITYRY